VGDAADRHLGDAESDDKEMSVAIDTLTVFVGGDPDVVAGISRADLAPVERDGTPAPNPATS
jgi:hypothetical protein